MDTSPKQKQSAAGKARKKLPPAVARWLFPLWMVALFSTLPVLFLYFNNASEVNFSTAAPLCGLFLLIGGALFLLLLLFIKNPAIAAIAASIGMLLFQNYIPLQTLIQLPLPGLRYIQVLPLVAVLFLHLCYLLYRVTPPDIAHRLTQMFCIGFSVVLVVVGAMAVPAIASKLNVQEAPATHTPGTGSAAGAENPNIYFLMFDEYSRGDVMAEYFGYDNTAIEGFLEERGFSVSTTSENEYPSTKHVTANLMMLDYVALPNDADVQMDQYRYGGQVHQLIEAHGYQKRGAGQSDYFGFPSATFDYEQNESSTVEGFSFSDLILKKTPLAPFLSEAFGTEQGDILLDTRDYFLDPATYTEPSNQFFVGYVSFPHEPFVFTAEGGYNSSDNWYNWSVPDYYRGQLIFTTGVMQEMVDGILANDPGAIIIIQSDHGARGLLSADGDQEIIPTEDKRKIFNAVYYRGEEIDIEGLSGVNTLRAVLARAWGEDLPPLEVPYEQYAE